MARSLSAIGDDNCGLNRETRYLIILSVARWPAGDPGKSPLNARAVFGRSCRSLVCSSAEMYISCVVSAKSPIFPGLSESGVVVSVIDISVC